MSACDGGNLAACCLNAQTRCLLDFLPYIFILPSFNFRWEIVRPEVGCCQCVGLSFAGWMSVILLVLLFWPLAWVPCFMPECFDPCQRPIYGYPPPNQQPYPHPGPPFGYGVPPGGAQPPMASSPPVASKV